MTTTTMIAPPLTVHGSLDEQLEHTRNVTDHYGVPRPDPHLSRWPENLDIRSETCGSSDAAPALGVDGSFTSNIDKFSEKTGRPRRERGMDPEPLWWGTVSEPNILRWWLEWHAPAGSTAHHIPAGTWRHPILPYLSDSPDGIGHHPDDGLGTFEAKNANEFKRDDWSREDSPGQYQIQNLMHLACHPWAQWSCMVVCIGGSKGVAFTMHRSNPVVAAMIEQLENDLTVFWWHVTENQPPSPRWHPQVSRHLADLYPAETPGVGHQLNPDLFSQYVSLRAEQKTAKEAADRLRPLIEHEMGDATDGYIGEQQVCHWSRPNQKGARVFRLKPAHTEHIVASDQTQPF